MNRTATIATVAGYIILALVAMWIVRTIWPVRETTTVTVIREDTSRVAAMRVELENLQGRIQEMNVAVTQKERESLAWKSRTARLQRLVDEMSGEPDTSDTVGTTYIAVPTASLERTVEWPGDSLAAPAVDTVRTTYDIARDLWLALSVGYAPREIRHTSSTTTVTHEEKGGISLRELGMLGAILLLTIALIKGNGG